MKKFSALIVALIAIPAFASGENTSATQTVRSAYLSLEKNDAPNFTALLTGSALSTYGTPEGFVALQRALTGMHLEFASAQLLSTDDQTQSWSVAVLSRQNPHNEILMADLLCNAQAELTGETPACSIFSILLED